MGGNSKKGRRSKLDAILPLGTVEFRQKEAPRREAAGQFRGAREKQQQQLQVTSPSAQPRESGGWERDDRGGGIGGR
jgi:hypothetical protein